MKDGMRRRELITGSLAAGAALAIPVRALADTLTADFDRTFATATPRVAAQASELTPYQRRIMQSAAQQVGRAGSSLWRRDIVGMADFAQPSSSPRLHFANLENGSIRSFLVAHGRGSDPEHDGWLKNFSNAPGSEATSRGAYLTCEWYQGKYGTSIRLQGLDGDNSNALDRAIVMHPAWYVDMAMVERWGKIGRSEGCFAMSPVDFNEALWHLSGGRLLYADRIGEG